MIAHPETKKRISQEGEVGKQAVVKEVGWEDQATGKRKAVVAKDTKEGSTNKKAKQSEAIHIPKKVYRPKMPNIYVDPPFIPDALEDLEPLFKE